MNIIKRLVKGSELSHVEMDANFTDLDERTIVLESSNNINSQVTSSSIGALLDVNTTGVTNGQILKYNSDINSWSPAADLSGGGGGGGLALTDLSLTQSADSGLGSAVYNNSTGQFTIAMPDLTPYAKTNQLFTTSDVDTHLNQSNPTTGYVLSWNGSDYVWIDNGVITETDPIFTASPANNITNTKITNWDTSYGWGDHSVEGYLKSFTETNTSLSLATNILKYTDEAGTVTNIDLSLYLDDTNLARLSSGTINAATGIATFLRDDASVFTVDFSTLVGSPRTWDTLADKNNANGPGKIALGQNAGLTSQSASTVAIGIEAGKTTQGSNSIAIGYQAGETTQGNTATAVGNRAGQTNQGEDATAIGAGAGVTNQGANALAIGVGAGTTNQAANSIVINATSGVLENTTASSLVIKPIASAVGTTMLMYDATSGQVTHTATPLITGDLAVEENYADAPTRKYFEVETGVGNNRIMRSGINMSTFGQSVAPEIDLRSYRASPADGDAGPELVFRASTAGSSGSVIATIETKVIATASGAETTEVSIHTDNAGTSVTPFKITGNTVYSASHISLADLKTEVAASADFAAFKARIAAL